MKALSRDEALAMLEVARADVVAAAGEIKIPLPDPGSVMAHMLIANRSLRRQRDEKQAEIDKLKFDGVGKISFLVEGYRQKAIEDVARNQKQWEELMHVRGDMMTLWTRIRELETWIEASKEARP